MNREDLTKLEEELEIIIVLHPEHRKEAEEIRLDMIRNSNADRKVYESKINKLYQEVYDAHI